MITRYILGNTEIVKVYLGEASIYSKVKKPKKKNNTYTTNNYNVVNYSSLNREK